MAGDDEIIRAYIDRVMRLRDRPSLGQADLDGIARELGFTEKDFERIESEVAGRRKRGDRFLKAGRFPDAVSELEQAVCLRPVDPALMHELARVHFAYARKTGDAARLDVVESWCRKAIAMDPAHEPSFHLLSSVETSRAEYRAGHRERRKKIGILVAALLAVIAGGAAALILLGRVPPPVPGTEQTFPEEAPYVAPPPLVENERNIPIRLAPTPDSAGISFLPQISAARDFGQSYSYTLKGTVSVRGMEEVKKLTLKLECLDGAGRLVAGEMVSARQDHEPAIRPGDVIPVGALVYEKKPMPDIRSARLSVSYVLKSPAQDEYSADPQVPVVWAGKMQGIDFAVFERSSVVTQSSRHLCLLTLCVKNTGRRPLSVVKLKVDWFDAGGTPIASTAGYAVADASTAQLPVGAQVPSLYIGALGEGITEFHRYIVTVEEAR